MAQCNSICQPPSATIQCRVPTRRSAWSRLGVAYIKLDLEVTVVSDCLHVTWESLPPLDALSNVLAAADRVARAKHHKSLEDCIEDERCLSDLLWQVRGSPPASEVLLQYRIGGVPAVPGTTVKGVMRSRIELATVCHNGEAASGYTFVDRGKPQLRRGYHGWRHGCIWCESIFEDRVRSQPGIDAREELLGVAAARKYWASRGIGSGLDRLGSRIYVSPWVATIPRTARQADIVKTVRVTVYDERGKQVNYEVECIPKDTRLRGSVVIVIPNDNDYLNNLKSNLLHDLGLVFYGLALTNKCCEKRARLLVGRFKYPHFHRNGSSFEVVGKEVVEEKKKEANAHFGEVEVELVGVKVYGTSGRWVKAIEPIIDKATDKLIRDACDVLVSRYCRRDGCTLRLCFDEVERKHRLP